MNTLSYKTVSATKENSQKEWFVVDATDLVLGRLAARVAMVLRGKHKPNFTPHADCGDNVIVLNADKIRLTGKKLTDRKLFRHTGYPGGQRIETPEQLLAKKPEYVIQHAVKGMLPKSRLGRALMKNLKVYVGAEHPHAAQEPKELNLNAIK